MARSYAGIMRMWKSQYWRTARVLSRLAPHASRIIDVGTGPGYLLTELHRVFPQAELTGVDAASEMIAIATETLASAGLRDEVALVEGDAYALPFDDGSFDALVATQFVHDIEDPTAFFVEARRVLRPSGLVLIVGERRDMAPPVYAAIWGATRLGYLGSPVPGLGPVTDASYTASELRAALLNAGLVDPTILLGPIRLEAHARVAGDA
jgi:ubiquinone/menaquinone biosynthesis C-methylase UbiE